MSEKHHIGIECRECGDQWQIIIPLTGNIVEVFATICPCGAIIVGNYNSRLIEQDRGNIRVQNSAISKDEKYLANGNFDILELTQELIKKLPKLALE